MHLFNFLLCFNPYILDSDLSIEVKFVSDFGGLNICFKFVSFFANKVTQICISLQI
jgi:hypothetical protein